MLKRHWDAGLDFASGQARLAWVRNRRRDTKLIGFQSIRMPPGLVEAGTMTDPVGVGDELRGWIQDLGLVGSRTVVAVPGPQAYMCRITMPRLRWSELKQAVYYQAYEFLPIPVEETAMDIFPIRRFQDSQGKKVELFFAAVRQQQVDDMILACTRAGLKPVVMEIEPLALRRAWGGDVAQTIVLLQTSSAHPYLTIFVKGVPIYHRSLTLGAIRDRLSELQESSMFFSPAMAGEGPDGSGVDLAAGLIEQVQDAVDYCNQHHEGTPMQLEGLILDAGLGMPGLESQLAQGLNLPVELAGQRAAARINVPEGLTSQQRHELEQDFALALGLAMRR